LRLEETETAAQVYGTSATRLMSRIQVIKHHQPEQVIAPQITDRQFRRFPRLFQLVTPHRRAPVEHDTKRRRLRTINRHLVRPKSHRKMHRRRPVGQYRLIIEETVPFSSLLLAHMLYAAGAKISRIKPHFGFMTHMSRQGFRP
jgi:hypothetical protein